MAEFTQQEAETAKEVVNEIMDEMSDSKTVDLLGDFNFLLNFLDVAIAKAPEESKTKGGDSE